MKQLIQNLKTGETVLEDVPAPQAGRGQVLIRTRCSLVSLGTERMLVEFGKANLLQKARQQPDKVKQVLDKIRTDGLLPTLEAVRAKLDQPIPLGYCNVGRVCDTPDSFNCDVLSFKRGDRVVSNGPHAEYVCVPKNLCARIPDNVTDEEAVFTVIGAIGLQGMRLCKPTFGETIVVMGLGLIGLLTTQMLLANGCQVIGIDIDASKCELARNWGVVTITPPQDNDVVKSVLSLTGDVGADGIIITASAKSNDIVSQAAQMSRKRGRIVLVGVVGLNLNRAEFYEKELSFQVSCSYGPGRYDETYERKGIDYPLPFVRWTEKRNFEAVLQAISSGRLPVKELITEVIDIENYSQIYGNMSTGKSIASILRYPGNSEEPAVINRVIQLNNASFPRGKGVIGIIGAGNFTKMTLLPALKGVAAGFKYIASAGGVTGTALARKFGFSHSTTDYRQILEDVDVDLVLITTRHNQHARMVIESLRSGKNVFVEKPLALNTGELDQIVKTVNQVNHSKPEHLNPNPLTISVGFNRRFSPHIRKMKTLLGDASMNVIATMNAGFIPPAVWVHDMQVGGGRIIGEACHFIDLITFLTGSRVKAVCMNAMGIHPAENTDNASILLRYENGSTGVINYFANGSKAYSKERVEVHSLDRTLVMDNFRKTMGYGFKGFSRMKTRMDKGHRSQFSLLIKHIKEGGEPLIPFEEIINTTLASFAAIESLKTGQWIKI